MKRLRSGADSFGYGAHMVGNLRCAKLVLVLIEKKAFKTNSLRVDESDCFLTRIQSKYGLYMGVLGHCWPRSSPMCLFPHQFLFFKKKRVWTNTWHVGVVQAPNPSF